MSLQNSVSHATEASDKILTNTLLH